MSEIQKLIVDCRKKGCETFGEEKKFTIEFGDAIWVEVLKEISRVPEESNRGQKNLKNNHSLESNQIVIVGINGRRLGTMCIETPIVTMACNVLPEAKFLQGQIEYAEGKFVLRRRAGNSEKEIQKAEWQTIDTFETLNEAYKRSWENDFFKRKYNNWSSFLH